MPPFLRPGLLDGRIVAFAGGGEVAAAACAALGAATPVLAADLGDEDAVTEAVAALGGVQTLVCDAASPFAAAGGGIDGLRAGLDGAWNAARAVANALWIGGNGGKLVLLGPRPADGAHAGALCAALENAARTLCIEWARHAIRPTALVPADPTSDDDVALLVAYLASPAGDYFSGCALRLGSVSAHGTSIESSVGESRATT